MRYRPATGVATPRPLARLRALLLATPPLLTSSPGLAQTGEWSSLDDEVEALTSSLAQDASVEVGGFTKFSYRRSDDYAYTRDPDTLEDLGDHGGFALDTMGLALTAERGPATGTVGYNPARRRIRSAYVAIDLLERATLTLGRFKAPLLRSRLVSTTRLLFLDRSVQGSERGPRDVGAKLELGLTDAAELVLAAQEGEDGPGSDKVYIARLNFAVLGGGVGKYEGVYGAGDGTALSVGLALSRDESLSDGKWQALDLALTRGRLGLAGEVLRYPGDESVPGGRQSTYDFGRIDPLSRVTWTDTVPASLTVSWMLAPDAWEAAARLEDFDDPNGTSRRSLALDRYVQGHDVKWQVSVVEVASDASRFESLFVGVGLVLRF